MTDDTLLRKAGHCFDRLDHDHDGRLSEADYRALAARACKAFGYPDDSPRARSALSGYLTLWRTLLQPTDADGDGAVSRAEYVDALAGPDGRGIDAHAYELSMGVAAAAFVDIADADRSGELDLEEFTTLYRVTFPDLTAEEVRTAFEAVDADNSATVSTDELKEAIRTYFTGTDAGAPADRLFGTLPD
ncbi:EF-hand domain-containing protein [Kitasatospora cineracea]|uniref:EF-hand domain-containing protein n=1 Tax=Kitasatospora cineracea TaxID=88074 RepID=UPI0036D7C12E